MLMSTWLPAGWREEAGHPGAGAPGEYGKLYPKYPSGYGYLWWSYPSDASVHPAHRGAFTGKGIFGQYLYVNPRERVVAVVWSAYPKPVLIPNERDTEALIAAAVEALQD